ncbi:MAG: FtsX-like permease family protein [Candidatus Heimdallarchaeota archaeon]|nr:FtsX-like permease family protein [Candidatus Heimdallarchaeota archaeon]
MFYAIKHALRGINRRKLKNVINILGILIGVSLLAGVQIATDSLVQGLINTTEQRYGDVDIVIEKYQNSFYNYSVYEKLRDDPLVAQKIDGIAPRIISYVSLYSFASNQIESYITLIGADEELDEPFGRLIPDGSYQNNDFNFSLLTNNQVILANRLAEVIEAEVSDPILFYYIDNQGNPRTHTVVVKGIAETQGKGVIQSGRSMFMKLSHLQTLFVAEDKINNIAISTTEGNENALETKQCLEEQLIVHQGEEDGEDYSVEAQKYQAYQDIKEGVKNFRIVLYVFGSLIIISGVMLILNITLMNIDERERGIGIMRAVGMTQRQLLTVLITESLVLGGIGSLLGLGGGILSGQMIIFLLENFLNVSRLITVVPLIISPTGLIASFFAGILLSLLAGIYPAWKASRLDIVETIREIDRPESPRSGNWTITIGGVLILAAIGAFTIYLVLPTDWRWLIFIGSILGFLFGAGFILARFMNTRLAFNLFSISWMITGIVSVLTLIPHLSKIGVEEDKALYTFLIAMLGLVFGAIIFVALNLEWLSDRFKDFFQAIKQGRAIGTISMRYVGKKKTRSALTFAIFGVILTMNVFLAVFTGSFTLGFDDFAENQQGGVDIIAYSPSGTPAQVGNPIQTIKDIDPGIKEVVGMKFRYSLFGAVTFINITDYSDEALPVPTDMWGVNDEFIEMTEYDVVEQLDSIQGNPFEAVKDGSLRRVVLPDIIREFEFEEGGKTYAINLTVGDPLWVPENISYETGEYDLVPYEIIAFVDTTSYTTLFSNFIWTGENSPLFTNVTEDTAYLIATDDRYDTEKNLEVSRAIESRLAGFDTLTLRDRIERLLDFIMQTVNFMQAFVSLGLVVGVLGLLVVSLRGVSERTREIGMMRALGFQKSEVILAVVLEIFAVAFVGLVIGFINGFILGYGMFTQYLREFQFRFIIPWRILLIFLGITILLSILAAVIPARRASKIPPSEALRYSG